MYFEFILQIIFMLIALYTLIYYFDTLFSKRKKSRYLMAAALYILIQLSMHYFGEDIPYINLFVNVTVTVAYGLFAYRGSRIKIALSGILYSVLWVVSEIMLMFFLMLIQVQYTNFILLGSFLTKLLLLIMVKLINIYFSRTKVSEIPKNYNAFVLLFPLSSIVIIACIFYIADRNYTSQIAIISAIACFVLLVTNFIAIKLYDKIVEELVLKNMNSLYAKQLQLCEEQIIEREETMLSIRTMRHDMKNHLLLLREMLENISEKNVIGYIDSLIVETTVKKEVVANTGNMVIDSLVNFKYAKARKENIDFKTHIVVPYNLPCSDADICIILGNLLDNAIEAATKQEQNKRFINLNITAKRNNLVMIIKNSYEDRVQKNTEGIIVTTKQNKQQHGYGLLSVKRVVDRYNGTMNIEYTELEFVVTVILFITYE